MTETDPIRWADIPSDEELFAARDVVTRLVSALYPVIELESHSWPVWDGLVEAKRMLAVTVSYLSSVEEGDRYAQLWERMLEEQG